MTAPRISQVAERLDLGWVAGDPVSLSFIVDGLNWSGAYTAEIRDGPLPAGTLLGTLTVTATLNGQTTEFLLEMNAADSLGVLAGTWWWDLQKTGGTTRLTGRVFVSEQITDSL